MVSLRWLVFLLLSAPLPLYCDRVPKESLYCKTWPDCVSDPHHTLFECLSWTKLKLQNNISPCHQGTYISAFQYDWHSCVSRTFLHGAHSSIAFLSFSFSLSVVEPSFNESMSHAWFLLLWTGHTGRKWHPTLMNTTASPPTPRSSTARMLSLRWPGEGEQTKRLYSHVCSALTDCWCLRWCLQVFDTGLGLDRRTLCWHVKLGPEASSSSCQNCCSDPHCDRYNCWTSR